MAAASLAFNVGAWVQKSRVARIKGEEAGSSHSRACSFVGEYFPGGNLILRILEFSAIRHLI
jgi:hypothetical protein